MLKHEETIHDILKLLGVSATVSEKQMMDLIIEIKINNEKLALLESKKKILINN